MGAGRTPGNGKRLLLGFFTGIGGDVAVFHHAIDHVIAPRDRFVAVAERIVVVRPFGQRGEVGGFGNGQFVHRLVEIKKRSRGDAVGAEPEINLIEIEFENLVLRIGAFDAQRQQRFLDLARDRHFVGEQEILGHLLGDGRGALRPAATAEILHIKQRRAGNAVHVDAGMLIEVLVLCRDKGVGHELRDRLNGQIEPPLIGIFGKQRAVGRVDARHHRRLVILQLRIIRQVFGKMPQNAGHGTNRRNEKNGSGGEEEAEEAQEKLHRRSPPAPAAPCPGRIMAGRNGARTRPRACLRSPATPPVHRVSSLGFLFKLRPLRPGTTPPHGKR